MGLRCDPGGLVSGIAIGALLSAVYFTLSYARVHVSSAAVVPSLSGGARRGEILYLIKCAAGNWSTCGMQS